jgi:hypothetical protein
MSVTQFACPCCRAILRTANPVREGRPVKCSRCGSAFRVGDPGTSTTLRPSSVAATLPTVLPVAEFVAHDPPLRPDVHSRGKSRPKRPATPAGMPAGIHPLVLAAVLMGGLVLLGLVASLVHHLADQKQPKPSPVNDSPAPAGDMFGPPPAGRAPRAPQPNTTGCVEPVRTPRRSLPSTVAGGRPLGELDPGAAGPELEAGPFMGDGGRGESRKARLQATTLRITASGGR